MRILWVFEHLWCQATMQQVANNLASRDDVELEVMCPWDATPPIDNAAIRMTRLHCRHKIDFAARRAIRAKMSESQFDIAHAYSSRDLANMLAAGRRVANRPQLVGYRGTVNRLQRFDPGHWMTFWRPELDRIICVCEATRQSLIDSNIAPAKLTTVWEGCHADILDTPPRSTLTTEFDIPADAFVVGTVANMRPVKGVDLLLQAAIALRDCPDIHFLLIGDVRDPRIEALASDSRISDRVRLAGAKPQGGRYSGLFDVYAAPSRMEGLSMGIMEAMSQRVCPLVTSVGGSPELVRHEVDGLVIPPEDPLALAAAIRRLYVGKCAREQMAASALQRTVDVFSIEHWTNRLHSLYTDALNAGRERQSRSAA